MKRARLLAAARARSGARRRCRRTPRCCPASTSRNTVCSGTRGTRNAATSTCRPCSTPPRRAAANRPPSSASGSSSTSPPRLGRHRLAPRLLLQEGRRGSDQVLRREEARDRVHSLLGSRRSRPLGRMDVEPAARGRARRPTSAWRRCSTRSPPPAWTRDAVHHLGRSRRPRPQPRRQDPRGSPDPLDRVGPRHPPRPPHRRPPSAPSTPRPRRCGSSAIRRPAGMIGKPVLEAFEPDPPKHRAGLVDRVSAARLRRAEPSRYGTLRVPYEI